MAFEEESELVAAAQGGDRRALDSLLRLHHDRLLNVCRRVTGNHADAADSLQNALIAIVRGLPSFDGRARFSTWSYRIAVNASLDEVRRRNRRPVLATTDDADERIATEDRVEEVAGRLDAESALRRLGPEQRAAVVLRDVCGLDYAEIAEVLDLPGGTVRSRIARGRAALVSHLTEPGPLPDHAPVPAR